MLRRHVVLGLPTLATAVRAADAPLQVVTSFSILADWVREIAADAAVVTPLVGANADAHVYEPTPADVRRLAR
jgi:zinc/manganese transport system substrate-binding protein